MDLPFLRVWFKSFGAFVKGCPKLLFFGQVLQNYHPNQRADIGSFSFCFLFQSFQVLYRQKCADPFCIGLCSWGQIITS